MSDDPEPFWPASREVEAVVGRAVAERLDPLRAQLTTVGRALAILAQRVPQPEQVTELSQRVDALASRLEEVAPGGASIASLERTIQAGLTEVGAGSSGMKADELRLIVATAVGRTVEQAVHRLEAATAADAAHLLDKVGALEASLAADAEDRGSQTDELRQALAVAVSHAVAKLDQARRPDDGRILERIEALEDPLRRPSEPRRAQGDEGVEAGAAAVERSLAQIEAARTADANRVLEQVAALEGPLTRDAIARQAQLDDLRQTVASTLDQAVSRLEAARSADAATLLDQVATLAAGIQAEAQRRDEQAAAMLIAVDERLQALHAAVGQAAGEQEGRLASRLEALTVEHGQALVDRIDERTAPITGLEAVPERVAAEVERATAAALTSQVEPLLARLIEAIDTLAHEGGRIEAMARGHAGEARAVEERVAALFTEVAERAETAVDRSRARISEGQVALGARFDSIMGEMLSSVSAATERLEARLAESAEGLRAASGHQNGALLDAVNRSGQQLSDGLTDVRAALFATGTESAARGAEADQRAESLAERLDSLRATVESIRHDPRLEALVVEQVAARDAQVAAIDAVSARIDEVGPVVARALLAEVERATRAANAAEEAVASLRPEDLRTALLEGAGRAADEVRAGTAMDDLRASQALLRAAVQEGAHKAEQAALDIRGLRERLAPHLVALADATTRRAEADQAGFDAVLARLDQLLAASHHSSDG